MDKSNSGQTAHSSQAIDNFVRIFELGYKLGFSDSEEGVHVSVKELALQCALQPKKEESAYLKNLVPQIG